MNKLWGDGTPLRPFEEYTAITERYEKAWKPYEKKILDAMTSVLGLRFRQNIIDVYIAPWFGAFSDPMVLGVTYDPDYFVDVLTHELIHRLLTDNTAVAFNYDILPEWKKLYGSDLDFNTLVHIPVHSVQKAVILDYLQEPTRIDRELKEVEEYPPQYLEAWNYVNEHDYKQLNQDLAALYSRQK